MKLTKSINILLERNLPRNLSVGKLYKMIVVDGETFTSMQLTNVNPATSELVFVGKRDQSRNKDTKHIFNYSEQEIILK